MTLFALEREIIAALAATHTEPALEARHLLAGALELPLTQIPLEREREISDEVLVRVRHWASRRAMGVPLAYLTGKKGFYKNDFLVGPGVLIPRPESEHILEVALQRSGEIPGGVQRIADLGCGSGILGISLLQEFPMGRLTAVDISKTACEFTIRNARALGVENRITVVEHAVENWIAPEPLQMVVANPPYIAVDDPHVQPSVKLYEPQLALFSGREGLECIRAWSHWTKRALAPGGLWICEIGAGQSEAARAIIAIEGFGEIRIQKDLAGIDRVISARGG